MVIEQLDSQSVVQLELGDAFRTPGGDPNGTGRFPHISLLAEAKHSQKALSRAAIILAKMEFRAP